MATRPRGATLGANDSPAMPLPRTMKSNCFIQPPQDECKGAVTQSRKSINHRFLLLNRTEPARDGSHLVIVREIRRVLQNFRLKQVPNFRRHFALNGTTDEEGVRFEILFGEGVVYPVQRSSACFPMFMGTGGINAAFEFTESNVGKSGTVGFF